MTAATGIARTSFAERAPTLAIRCPANGIGQRTLPASPLRTLSAAELP